MKYELVRPTTTTQRLVRLGQRAHDLCLKLSPRLHRSLKDEACRWAYLYTQVGCSRDNLLSCIWAKDLTRVLWGKAEADKIPEPRPLITRKPTPKPKPCMDEVACLLASTPPRCCARYRRRPLRRPLPVAHYRFRTLPRQPFQLTSSQIRRSFRWSRVRRRLARCKRLGVVGRVLVHIWVSASGTITRTRVRSAPTPRLGRCVDAAITLTRFPRTRYGYSFTFPFWIR